MSNTDIKKFTDRTYHIIDDVIYNLEQDKLDGAIVARPALEDFLRAALAQHDAKDAPDDARILLIHSLVSSKGWNGGYAAAFVDDWFHARFAATQPAGYQLVPIEFLAGFNTLAHNYSLQAVAPDYYSGTERDAFMNAYARCGNDLAKLSVMLAAAPASQRLPLAESDLRKTWVSAQNDDDLSNQYRIWLSGFRRAEAAHGITQKGE